jgi:dolichol-phosphate mannosyltransferase
VIASRYVEGGHSDNGPLLRAMSRSLNFTYGLVLGLKCHDISTNFKLFHYRDVRDVTLSCSNFDIVEELLFRVRQERGPALRIVEIPDYFHERDEGETKRQLGPFVASYLLTLTRLRLRG